MQGRLYAVSSTNNHVNLSQSTNDVYPTAIRIAALFSLRKLVTALENPARGARGEGRGVRPRDQDGPDAAPGRRCR